MHQTYDATTTPEQGPPRLSALRAAMVDAGVDGFLVPRADAHMGEYVAPRDDRLAWLTGFTGSAGFCVVLKDIAGVFIDGRYTLQVRDQVSLEDFTPVPWPKTQLADWLIEKLPNGGVVGFDPWLHPVGEIDRTVQKLASHGISLQAVGNLVDTIWEDQPAPPLGEFLVHPDSLAGEASAEKAERLAAQLREAGERAAVITLPDSIAWLLNIRGQDIPRNPIPHAFAILHDSGLVDLYAAPEKITEDVLPHLANRVSLFPPDAFGPGLEGLQGKVRLDKSTAPEWVRARLSQAEVLLGQDPCVLPKARKNPAELSGMTEAHLRDGATVADFLAWIDREAPTGALTEIDVAKELERRRALNPELRDISFDSIVGAGPHGAIVHYRVTEQTNRTITPGDILLVDSGGQFVDGTTDVTRTIATGDVTDEQKAAFTRVLKGMIALSRLRWPPGIAGRDIDALARVALWEVGMDFDHGTGHGVGAYLCVHEGPQRIARTSSVPLEPGMVLSNEPGYYREGEFGIRIENLVYVIEATPFPGGDDRPFLAFETLTFVPIDKRLIDPSLLSTADREWLDDYHARVRDHLINRVAPETREWLEAATAPL